MLLVVALLLSGCGVEFGSAKPGTEFFKSLKVSGTTTAGSPLTLALTYEQNNPVAVNVKCELRQGTTLVKAIGEETVPLLAGGGPEATPVAGNYSFDFVVDRPGTYRAECYTPADENDYIIREFTVTDSEATSQTRLFLAETGAPISDVRVCFVPGGSDVNGTLSPPIGPELRVRVRGSVDVSGRHPRASIDSVRIGALPSFVARPFLGLVSRLIDEQTNQIELDHRISVQLLDGQAVISGQP